MDTNSSLARASRWRVALASVALATAVGGGLFLVMPQQALQAQQRTELSRAPLSFADIVERVKPAVVSIQVSAGAGPKVARAPTPPRGGGRDRDGGRGGNDSFPNLPDDHPLNEFFRNMPRGAPQRPTRAQGSGFVISPDGYLITNNHVIDSANKVQVIFDQNNKYDADLIGTDQRTDLALLKIKAPAGKTFPYVKLSDALPRIGDWVIAVGNPFGLGGSVTAGIVSAHGRDIGSGPYDYMQIDAAVNKGNSGGPTFNLDGDVIGVNTAIYSPTGGSVGIAFAIPAKTVNEVVTQLKSSGSVKRGWLGVRIQSLDDDMAASLGLTETKGALVNEVTVPGPAAEAGVKNGDTILAVNGVKIADSRDLARQIANFAPGTKVDVKVLRGQREQVIGVKLGTLPTAQELAKAGPPGPPTQPTELEQLGLTVSPTPGPDSEGVVVTDVNNDSDAAQKNIRVGDVILEIGGAQVSSADDVVAAIREAGRLKRRAVLLRIKSGNEPPRFVAIQLRRS
jgi:serine protease Do